MAVDPKVLEFAIKSVPIATVLGTFYRSVDLRVVAILGTDVLSGAHAGKTGGRFNEPGSPPTSYFAGSQTLASLECEQDLLLLAIPPPTNPRLVVAMVVKDLNILDLTNSLVLAHLSIHRNELLIPTNQWRFLNDSGLTSVPQMLGNAARAREEIDGILAPSWFESLLGPSELPRMQNLILFMDPKEDSKHRNPAVSLQVNDPDGLLPGKPALLTPRVR